MNLAGYLALAVGAYLLGALPTGYLATILLVILFFEILPYLEELWRGWRRAPTADWRCWRTRSAGPRR